MTHGSTFSGIGGPEVAAAMLGWDNVFHCEINPFGRKILDYYFKNAKSYEDITKTDFSEWRGRIDILTGGFPCQPFSYAGKRRGSEDDRYLWPYMLRCIDQIRPTWFVGENVDGIASMVLPGETTPMASAATLFDEGDTYEKTEQRFVIEEICRNLESIGYEVQPMLIPACGVGAPHRIDRIFFIAHRLPTTNTDCCNDGPGVSGENESESGKERISKRNQIQQPLESTDVRPKVCWPTSDSEELLCNGIESGDGKNDNTQRTKFGDRNCSKTCGGRFSSNTESEQGDGMRPKQRETRVPRAFQFGGGSGENGSFDTGERWRAFPTVSPVHRGNDGLPFPVDRLTIPFNKWRNESLKAYGNAIVPQVMYEIFRCIEKIENAETKHE